MSRRSRRFRVDPDDGLTQAPVMPTIAELAAFAEELAEVARRESLHRWADIVDAENKGSDSYDPVTDADR